jgi:hypothetical protein
MNHFSKKFSKLYGVASPKASIFTKILKEMRTAISFFPKFSDVRQS